MCELNELNKIYLVPSNHIVSFHCYNFQWVRLLLLYCDTCDTVTYVNFCNLDVNFFSIIHTFIIA